MPYEPSEDPSVLPGYLSRPDHNRLDQTTLASMITLTVLADLTTMSIKKINVESALIILSCIYYKFLFAIYPLEHPLD